MKSNLGISGKLPLVVIIALLAVLILGAGGFGFYKLRTGSRHTPHKPAPVELTPWELGEFVVNLTDPQQHYLKVSITLEVAGKKAGGGEGEDPEKAKARDSIIKVLTAKSYNFLLSTEGKEILKREIISSLNHDLGGTKIDKVYFTDFAMQ